MEPRPDQEPSPERQDELRRAAQANGQRAEAVLGPFDGVAIHSRAELRWILDAWPWTDPATGGARRPNLSGAIIKPAPPENDQQSEQRVDLSGMRLHEIDFIRANLAYADLHDVHLEGANLHSAYLYQVNMDGAQLEETDLSGAGLWRASLVGAFLSRTKLRGAHLSRANLSGAILWKADLRRAYLHGTNLSKAYLTGVDLRGAQLSNKADLRGARLNGSTMNETTEFRHVVLDNLTELSDVVWGGVDLAHVDWDQIKRLGDEHAIRDARDRLRNHRQEYKTSGERWDTFLKMKIGAYDQARQAYHALGMALREQGLSQPASRFRWRAQIMERGVLRWRWIQHPLDIRRLVTWWFSILLDVLAGYGERPINTAMVYIILVLGFAEIYFAIGHQAEPLVSPVDWIILSLTSFHGRGFLAGDLAKQVPQHSPITILAVGEAVLGLFVELSFIASFSRRFLGD